MIEQYERAEYQAYLANVDRLAEKNEKRRYKEQLWTSYIIVLVAALVVFAVLFFFKPIAASDNIWKGSCGGYKNTAEYSRQVAIRRKHGYVLVASDFSHFIRLNGEVAYCHGRW